MPEIILEHVTKKFDDFVAVDDLNMVSTRDKNQLSHKLLNIVISHKLRTIGPSGFCHNLWHFPRVNSLLTSYRPFPSDSRVPE